MALVDLMVGLFLFFFPILILFLIFVLFSSIRVISQWERGVRFRLGKYKDTLEPGLRFVIPIFDSVRRVDIRVITIDIQRQQVITKDNVPLMINGVLYFKVNDPAAAIVKVQEYQYAMTQYAQTALRDVVGSRSLDDVLTERESIGKQIEEIVDKATDPWGIQVTDIKLQDVDMPEDLKRLMSRQASSEREKRANIIKSEGDRLAADNLSKAAAIMAKTPGAMQLRTLQTLDGLGPTSSNTVVLAVPVDVLELAQSLSTMAKNKVKSKK